VEKILTISGKDVTFLIEPEDVYHAKSKSGAVMSSHMLETFKNSPFAYQQTTLGKAPYVDSKAYAVGTAAHKMILEGGRAFSEAYNTTTGPINEKTGKPYATTTKTYKEWLEDNSDGRIRLNQSDLSLCLSMSEGVKRNSNAVNILEEGEPELVTRGLAYDVGTCQICTDWLSPKYGIVDLKTCKALRWFESDAKKFGYIRQFAFYRRVLRDVTGIHGWPFYVIAVEKEFPFSCGVWKISEAAMDAADAQNEKTFAMYAKCAEGNEWPEGYEMMRVFDA